MISTKKVSISGAVFDLCGYESDPYFCHVASHLEHGFLIPLLFHHMPSNAGIIDVGANIGGTTALMHSFAPNPSIVCIEPSRMFACLEATIAANAFPRTHCLNLCAGKTDGLIDFVDCGDYAGSSGSSASHSHIGNGGATPGPSQKIPIRRLDTIAADLRIEKLDLVKIDVEGYEEDVLDGMSGLNDAFKPFIFMEFNAFCISAHAEKSPYALLRRIRDQFGGFIGTVAQKPQYYSTDGDLRSFFLRHMTENGCVEDIVFSNRVDLREAFALQA